VPESQDTLAAAGKDVTSLLVDYLKKMTRELLAMLAKKNFKWIYKSKGVKKGDMATLLHR
jgi:hypothetical protein